MLSNEYFKKQFEDLWKNHENWFGRVLWWPESLSEKLLNLYIHNMKKSCKTIITSSEFNEDYYRLHKAYYNEKPKEFYCYVNHNGRPTEIRCSINTVLDMDKLYTTNLNIYEMINTLKK